MSYTSVLKLCTIVPGAPASVLPASTLKSNVCSAAASLVAYCLGITHVDPLRHGLLFERFLNEGRQDPPDIDVDFPWDERGEVLRYVMDKYGPDHCAMVAAHVGFRPRAARLLSPDHEPVKLDIGRYGDSWAVIVPEVDLYGVVVAE